PPLPDRGRLLIDGGVLDNLPVRVMASLAPGIRVAAVDVNPYMSQVFTKCPDYGDSLGGATLLRSFNPFAGKSHLPGIQTILERATMLGSVSQAQAIQELLTIYVHAPTDDIGFMDMNRMDAIADLG